VCCLKLADLTNDQREKAELLNNYFSYVFTLDDGSCPVLPSRITVSESLSSVYFTASNVFRKLGFLKPDTTPKTCK